MVGLYGFGGQLAYNLSFRDRTAIETSELSLFDRLARSKWIPLKTLSNEQYEDMLQEKLLQVETEIAVIDDKILAIQAQPHERDRP